LFTPYFYRFNLCFLYTLFLA